MPRKMTKEQFVRRMLEDIAAREQAETDERIDRFEQLEQARRRRYVILDYKWHILNQFHRKYGKHR